VKLMQRRQRGPQLVGEAREAGAVLLALQVSEVVVELVGQGR
jgi:hypothetical protein